MEFEKLVSSIQNTHEELQLSAIKAVNQSLTLRNWLIGLYIIEFEQKGKERAKYGEQLLPELAASIKIKGLSVTNLRLCRQFYIAYPHLISAVKDTLINSKLKGIQIGPSMTDQLQKTGYESNTIHQSTTDELNQAFRQPIKNGPLTDPVEILSKISFTHLVQLLPIQNLEKRTFYELECIRQAWSVGELKRQINTLYYERSGISKKPDKLSKIINQKAEQLTADDVIKSPFTFEFLGLKAKDVVYENDLEKSLLEHLEGFLLEMGQGFCFEAKQKRILIGGEYFFIDLVFYHRILKCHVLVELKIDEAKHEHIGQLKTYVNYYKKEMMQKDDNPPVGLLLVTNQNKALVEYAIADSDQQLFVSKYLLELPSEEELIAEIEREKNILREQGIVYGREN
ncbi:PDDEXK nuclease domain-containing protein [Sphingobacterium detergens]|uniref:Putative nuclease of restriction endonuclease-like (RecB) superfamily n=1 Tax=Sphingobacterium detergens TaxID=1145106 RepID=A0A420BF73_SPHD1|nr:PDDEXK nuclease domain-containing protein [Sphingobacterium detergens]RKE55361.1 putative nuclease of restriction endonuclease-like (RecB) superfamily [Sphingobacterium detergens]